MNAKISTENELNPLQKAFLSSDSSIAAIQLLINKIPNASNSLQFNETDDSTKNCRKIVEFLLSQEINLNLPDTNYSTLLHFVMRYGDEETFNLALSKCQNFNSNALNCQQNTLLHEAVKADKKEITKILIDRGAEIDVKDPNKLTPLYYAASCKNKEIIEMLLSHGADVNAKSDFVHRTPLSELFKSIFNDKETYPEFYDVSLDLTLISLMLDYGGDVNVRTDCNRNLISEALSLKLWDIVHLLLKYGAQFELNDAAVTKVLEKALKKKDFSLIKLILTNSLNINNTKKGRTPIQLYIASLPFGRNAMRGYKPEMIQFLIQCGVDINGKSKTGDTALHIAAERSILDIARYLIEHGADVHAKNTQGETPLIYAWLTMFYSVGSKRKYFTESKLEKAVKMFKLLYSNESGTEMKLPCDYNSIASNQRILLSYSLEPIQPSLTEENPEGNVRKCRIVVEFLLKRDFKLKIRKQTYSYLLHLAATFGDDETFKLVLHKSRNFNLHAVNKEGKAILHVVIENHRDDLVSELLDLGVNIEKRDKYKNTPLHYAITANSIKLVKILVEGGADINTVGHKNKTPLAHASREGKLEIISFLLQKGTDVEVPDKCNRTPLMQACRGGHLDVLMLLLSHGADISKKNNNARTALHFAVLSKNLDVVEFLLQTGFNVNEKNYYGDTALSMFFGYSYRNFKDDLDMLDMLVDYAIDIDVEHLFKSIILKRYTHYKCPKYAEYFLAIKADFLKFIDFSKYRMWFEYQELNCFTVAVAYIAMREEKYKTKTSGSVDVWLSFFKQCQLELLGAKRRRVCIASQVTFYDLLMDDLTNLASITENEKIMEVLNSGEYKNEFPCYALILEEKIERIKQIAPFLRTTASFLEKYAKVDLPDLVLSKIFSYLSLQDFRRLMRALAVLRRRS